MIDVVRLSVFGFRMLWLVVDLGSCPFNIVLSVGVNGEICVKSSGLVNTAEWPCRLVVCIK